MAHLGLYILRIKWGKLMNEFFFSFLSFNLILIFFGSIFIPPPRYSRLFLFEESYTTKALRSSSDMVCPSKHESIFAKFVYVYTGHDTRHSRELVYMQATRTCSVHIHDFCRVRVARCFILYLYIMCLFCPSFFAKISTAPTSIFTKKLVQFQSLLIGFTLQVGSDFNL